MKLKTINKIFSYTINEILVRLKLKKKPKLRILFIHCDTTRQMWNILFNKYIFERRCVVSYEKKDNYFIVIHYYINP